MDYYFNQQRDFKHLFEFKDVSEKTQLHLQKVYRSLAVCTAVCALGMYVNAYTVITGWISEFLCLIGMAYMMYKINSYDHEDTRTGYLWALAFFMGYLVGPAMHHLNFHHP